MTDSKRGSLAVFCAALLWSTGGLFIKSVSLDAWGVSFWRSGFAAVCLYLVYRRQPGLEGRAAGWWSPWVWLAAVNYAALLVLFVFATKLTTSANAIFLQYTAPIYVVFIEPLMQRKKLRADDLGSVLLCSLAMTLFFVGKVEVRGMWGNVCALGSGVAFASYMLMLKHDRLNRAGRWQCVVLGHALITLMAGVLGLCGITHLAPAHADLAELAYLGVIQIGASYALFTWGIQFVRALDASLICMAEPVLNPVWVFLGIGEKPGGYAMLGGAIILTVSLYKILKPAA